MELQTVVSNIKRVFIRIRNNYDWRNGNLEVRLLDAKRRVYRTFITPTAALRVARGA